MTDVRAVAVGIPDRLKEPLAAMAGVVVVPDLVTAAGVLDDWPTAYVIYGEDLFGAAVTGLPVFLIPDQDQGYHDRVIVLMDVDPRHTDALSWDDARRLAPQAGVRLRARRLVDVSSSGAWLSLDALLDGNPPGVDTPREGGVS
jgi:hypothetical protein